MKSRTMKSSERNVPSPAFTGSEESQGQSESIPTDPRQIGEDISKDLPREFVNYLRSLFDILDHEKCGFVKITDIESYWDVKGSSFSGVLHSLKKVTPLNGLLNFDELCRGLKLAIRTSNPKTNTTRDTAEWTSDSSEDSFRIREDDAKEVMDKCRDSDRHRLSKESLDSLPVNSSNSNLTNMKANSTTKVYFVGNENGNDGLRGGSKIGPPVIDKKTRSSQVEEELETLKSGLTVIEKARKWYFRRITAIQEEKLHLQQSDQISLEQFQYEMLLHNTRRKELNLTEGSFRCYKRNIEELNTFMAKLIENPFEPVCSPKPVEASNSSNMDELQHLRTEIYAKNNRISQLEREKSALIRDLFNAKATVTGSGTKLPSDK